MPSPQQNDTCPFTREEQVRAADAGYGGRAARAGGGRKRPHRFSVRSIEYAEYSLWVVVVPAVSLYTIVTAADLIDAAARDMLAEQGARTPFGLSVEYTTGSGVPEDFPAEELGLGRWHGIRPGTTARPATPGEVDNDSTVAAATDRGPVHSQRIRLCESGIERTLLPASSRVRECR